MKHSCDCIALAGPEDLLRQFLVESFEQCLGYVDAWLATHDREAYARAMALLVRILAVTEFMPVRRLQVFCHQWRELLSDPDKVESAGPPLHNLVLHAGIRIEQTLATGHSAREAALLDAGSMNRLRAARGVAEYDMGYRLAENAIGVSPKFIRALQCASQTLLTGSSICHTRHTHLLQVAGFWGGYRHIASPAAPKPDLTPAHALLRLNLLCVELLRGNGSGDVAKSVPEVFQGLSRQALLRGLGRRFRACVHDIAAASPGQNQLNLLETLWVLAQIRVCLRSFSDQAALRGIDVLCTMTERLVMHLFCKADVDPLDIKMLLASFLSMEKRIAGLLSDLPGHARKHRSGKPVEKKLHHYLRAHHAAVREALQVPGQDALRRQGLCEMQILMPRLMRALRQLRNLSPVQAIPDEIPALWSQLSVCALCMGQVALYEVFKGIHTLFLMAVERRVTVTIAYLRCLGGLLAAVLRLSRIQPGIMPGALLLAAHQMACARVLAARHEPVEGSVPMEEVGGSITLASRNLPVHLAAHLNRLVEAPEALARSAHQPVDFLAHSRACLLELDLLTQGARALSVLRVADLAEGLAEVHRVLQIEQGCPARERVMLLCNAHRTLRTCLNHAAARQTVPDVRAVLFRLHAWLESVPPCAARSRRDNVVVLARTLTAGTRSLEDALVLLAAGHRQGLPMLRHQLADQLGKCLQLEEELEDAELVCLGRWRPRLWRVAARCAGEIGQPVRMSLENDALRIPRSLAEMLLPTLEHSVRWLLRSCCESAGRSEGGLGEGMLRLCVRPRLQREALVLTLTCAGGSAPQTPCSALPDIVLQALELLGGGADYQSDDGRSSHIRLFMPASATRWDIAGKPL